LAGLAPWEFGAAEAAERRERAVWETEGRLAAIAAGFRPCGTKVTTEVRGGRAAREIVAVATDRGADLIVMGTQGRTGLAHVVYGSVAEQVIRKAPCPVLAVCERLIDRCPEMLGAAVVQVV
jgi:nucleotide-binding universal stress UspA family protein